MFLLYEWPNTGNSAEAELAGTFVGNPHSCKDRSMEVQNHRCQKVFGLLLGLTAMFFSGIASAQTTQLVSTGNPDGKLGALSRRPSTGKAETETADDFFLKQTTVISGASITGLISPATPVANIANVEVEIY